MPSGGATRLMSTRMRARSLISQTRIELWRVGHTTGPVRTLLSKGINDPRIEVDEISWSADGSLVAGLTNSNPVVIWEAATGEVKQVLKLLDRPHKSNFVLRESLAWSPVDLHHLLISDWDLATLWDVQQNKLLLKLETNDPVPTRPGSPGRLTGNMWREAMHAAPGFMSGMYR